MAKGIYKITNDRTGESYIGQSNNMYRRYLQHMNELANGTHHNRGMQSDYNRGDKFSFEILELVDGSKKDLYEHEKIQIKKHNSFYAGYNQTPGGEYDQFKGAYQYGGGRKFQYNAISVEEHIKKSKKQNKKSTTSSNSSDDNLMMVLLCICGILSIYISFAILEIPIAFPPILIGLMIIVVIIFWIIEKINSFKNK